jgi:4'-phosphopantetheinyl transferase
MTAASGGRARRDGTPPAEQAAEVSWFDVREVTLGPADLAALDAPESARAAAFMSPAGRHAYQVAHVMLRRVLAGHLGTEPGRVEFARRRCPRCGGPAGRPVLAGPGAAPGLAFSLAHSGDAVAIAVARRAVGVDVERQAAGCVCSLTGVMHPDDAAMAEALPEPERHAAVIGWWVRAEAALKCAGTGIAHGMDAFPVLSGSGRPGAAGAPGCWVTALPAPKGFQAAIAAPRPGRIRCRGGPGRP